MPCHRKPFLFYFTPSRMSPHPLPLHSQYCPGPMKTDMTAAQHSLEWPWVEPEDSARAMVALIQVAIWRAR